MSGFSSKVKVENSTQDRLCRLDRLRVNRNCGFVTEFSAMNSIPVSFCEVFITKLEGVH